MLRTGEKVEALAGLALALVAYMATGMAWPAILVVALVAIYLAQCIREPDDRALKSFNVKRGECIVVRMPGGLPSQEYTRAQMTVQARFPENRVLVIPEQVELASIGVES